MAKQVMLGVRLDAETRAAFKAWCAARQVTAQAVLRDDVALHLASPAVPPIPRDRALVQVLRPRPWPKSACGGGCRPGRQGASAASPWDELWERPSATALTNGRFDSSLGPPSKARLTDLAVLWR